MKQQQGFTLIELVVVIVILGVLAVTAMPRFINMQDEAQEATFVATASAFASGVKQVHLVWQMRGKGQAIKDFIPIADPIAGGDLSVNQFGYPADTRGRSLTLNSTDDCLDVWRAVLVSQGAEVTGDNSAAYNAFYHGQNDCTYTYNAQPRLQVYYDSNSGEVRTVF
uniref:prepilin-type N-terminal cleavage/methylation domain-containing protein n=1 Tax=Thaumasiovibrio occultus TaxID=1891184 RepID=UPI00131E96C9|nr:prepilin-type N-terminal cleavage/methylation domain-containing protein [Thaumasiovibrio occultus]